MRRLLALAFGCVLLVGCDATSTQPPGTAAPTARPTFDEPVARSNKSPEQIIAEIEPLMGQGGVVSLGEGALGVVLVGLRANAEGLARDLVVRYGWSVEVTVGIFPYPPPKKPKRACATTRLLADDHRPLNADVAIEASVRSGEEFEGKVRITNGGADQYDLSTSSSFSVYLFRAGETEPIGITEGGWMGTGLNKTLAPGESIEFPAGGGTASCDLALGYVLPAGAYFGRALVDFQELDMNQALFFWSDPAPIQVVDP